MNPKLINISGREIANQTRQTTSESPLMLKDFSFNVPDVQIAQEPLPERQASKLLVWDGHHVSHTKVKNICEVVPEGSLFIVNNSRVIASRIHGHLKTGARVEILLLEPAGQENHGRETWLCLGKPMRKMPEGTEVSFSEGLTAKITKSNLASEQGPHPFEVELNLSGSNLLNWLDKNGEMPLPPYIDRKSSSKALHDRDRESYQTVYSQGLGSVAAPTAGLHFSESVMASLKQKKCEFAPVTLHVGAGTFLPVKTPDPKHHAMHSERFLVPRTTLLAIESARLESRKIIVVGTTALRSLEGLCDMTAKLHCAKEDLTDRWLRTDIFIRPEKRSVRYRPWRADAIMTNFHQPESTLFMFICALIGFDAAHHIYKIALKENYRFFSYGDSSLLWL